MNDSFAAAMGRALERTRAGDPMDATRIIQAALADKGAPAAGADTATAAQTRPARPHGRLGQVVDSLLSGKRRALRGRPGGYPAPTIEVPQGARYERHSHVSAQGQRDYTLFVPTPRAEPVQGLVVMLHGCTQNADDFAVGTRMNVLAQQHNLLVAYPEQTRTDNHMGCWNWFRPQDQVRGGEAALLADLAGNLALAHGVSPRATFVAGLSAGGAMAAILGRAYPEVFAGVGVHSGLPPAAATDVATAFAAMNGQAPEPAGSGGAPVPTIVLHGTADKTVHPLNAERVLRAALGQGDSLSTREDATATGAARMVHRDPAGRLLAESWTLHGTGHAWSGGAAEGSHTAPQGVDASAEMVRFFLELARENRA